MRILPFPLLLSLTFALRAQGPLDAPNLTAEAIMARVAANQDRTEAARAHFVYVQHARVLSRKGKKIRCEEVTDTRVLPSPDGSTQQLLKLEGRLLAHGQYVTYTQLPDSSSMGKTGLATGHDDLNIELDDTGETDRDLVEHMRNNLIASKAEGARDGLNSDLFPLTTVSQADLGFTLLGRESLNGRTVFHLRFQPKDHDEFGWKGETYIDVQAFQPVLVRTAMSRPIPFAVRTLLGTSLPGLGFTVIYAPQAGGVWFPVSFGTEFKMHLLFFFRRDVVLSAENRDFEETHVASHIGTSPAADVPAPPAPRP